MRVRCLAASKNCPETARGDRQPRASWPPRVKRDRRAVAIAKTVVRDSQSQLGQRRTSRAVMVVLSTEIHRHGESDITKEGRGPTAIGWASPSASAYDRPACANDGHHLRNMWLMCFAGATPTSFPESAVGTKGRRSRRPERFGPVAFAIWHQRGLQPIVLGIGATRPRRSAVGSVNQIELQSGPTATPAGPRLDVCAR